MGESGTMSSFEVGSLVIGRGQPLSWICGPCIMESREMVMETAAALAEIFQGRPWIFKSCYDKANRSSIHGFRGPGIKVGLDWLCEVRDRWNVPVISDVHSVEEANVAGAVLDCLQIPAFLCRQTDLLVAAARTGAVINVKKGQFMAPSDMGNVVEKIQDSGNRRMILTERGFSFGYNNLVVDFRSIPIMQEWGVPVCFDATHSCMHPGALGACSGGSRQFSKPLAHAAVACGADMIFLETHPDPTRAKSDAAVQYPLEGLRDFVESCEALASCRSSLVKSCAAPC